VIVDFLGSVVILHRLMPNKLFISYRREDSAANAIGIGQYLENRFGRKNVFIDVDMRAGSKFPEVLERNLSECKVMLVLIGPGWLNACDDQGRRRLDSPDDWVRLEIARALNRGITVIPVRVNGAALPSRESLPKEIHSLVDNQAASVASASFRNDMAGLARDIQLIPSAQHWRRLAVTGTGLSLVLVLMALALIQSPDFLHRIRGMLVKSDDNKRQEDIWENKPGEWVMFGLDAGSNAYYYKPSSINVFGDKVAYTARYPLAVSNLSDAPLTQTAAYRDSETVLDCQKSIFAEASYTYYNKSGEAVSHYKSTEPKLLDLSSVGQPIKPGSVVSAAQQLLCDEQQRQPILNKQQLSDMKLSFLAPTTAGDGDIFYQPEDSKPGATEIATILVLKYHESRALASLFHNQNYRGLSVNYRTEVSRLQGNCKTRKFHFKIIEQYDNLNNLVRAESSSAQEWKDVIVSSPLAQWLDLACNPPHFGVEGIYEGTVDAKYNKGGEGEQKISIKVDQVGDELSVIFQTAAGGQGKGTGKLIGADVNDFSLQSTTPGCAGSYTGSLTFEGDTVRWSYKGDDCGGQMEGHGTAKRAKT
jgi:TIR domain